MAGDYTVYFKSTEVPILWVSSAKTAFVRLGKESADFLEVKAYGFAIGVFLLLAASFSRAPMNLLLAAGGGAAIYKSVRKVTLLQMSGTLGIQKGVEFFKNLDNKLGITTLLEKLKI